MDSQFPLPPDFWRTVVDSMGAGVVVADHSGRLRYFNPKAEELLGMGTSEAAPSDWSRHYGVFRTDRVTVYPPEELPLVQALQGRFVRHAEMLIRNVSCPQGRFIAVTGSPIRDEQGRLCGAVAVLEDIDAQKELEFERAQRAEILAEQVRLRTQALHRSNEELTRFTHAVSHDLKEPIRSIRMLAQLLERKQGTSGEGETARYLQEIGDRAQDLTRFVDELLAFAKDTGDRERQSITDLNEVVVTTQRFLSTSLKEGNVQVHCGRLPRVVAEASPFIQLFQNLISNSVKYRSTESPEIWIDSRAQGDRWLFWVQDNGIGIAEDQKEAVFRPFHRLERMPATPGTGIGLAICRKVVERFGGEIWLESHPGQRTTFYFTLPMARVAFDGDPEPDDVAV